MPLTALPAKVHIDRAVPACATSTRSSLYAAIPDISTPSRRLVVDSRHHDGVVSIGDTMARTTAPALLHGTLDMLILRTLQTEPMHGWATSDRIQQISPAV